MGTPPEFKIQNSTTTTTTTTTTHTRTLLRRGPLVPVLDEESDSGLRINEFLKIATAFPIPNFKKACPPIHLCLKITYFQNYYYYYY